MGLWWEYLWKKVFESGVELKGVTLMHSESDDDDDDADELVSGDRKMR